MTIVLSQVGGDGGCGLMVADGGCSLSSDDGDDDSSYKK